MASNTLLESVAAFESQAKRAGLNEQWIEAFGRNDLNKLGRLAYAVTTPGVAPTTEQVTDFMNHLRLGVGPTLSEITAVKRVLFEAQTLTIASLRSTVHSPDDASTRRVAPAERSARIEAQRQRLQGLELSGPMEPSHWLYDQFSAMLETGELKYISPGKCMTRQQELSGDKPDKQIKLDETRGSLVVKDKPHDQETDITSDLSLLQAMTRRALAMDLVGIASYNAVMKFVNRLFALLTQLPAPGFGRPGHAQLLRADRQAFMRLAETVSPPYHINAAGVLPLDLAFDQLHNDVTVTYHMLPVPLGRHRDDDKTSNATSTKTPPIKKTPGGNKTGGAPSSKGKGGGKNKRQPMPHQLHGMHHKTPSGKAICFNFNLGKCKDKKCPREHVCCMPGCYKNHPQTEHEGQ